MSVEDRKLFNLRLAELHRTNVNRLSQLSIETARQFFRVFRCRGVTHWGGRYPQSCPLRTHHLGASVLFYHANQRHPSLLFPPLGNLCHSSHHCPDRCMLSHSLILPDSFTSRPMAFCKLRDCPRTLPSVPCLLLLNRFLRPGIPPIQLERNKTSLVSLGGTALRPRHNRRTTRLHEQMWTPRTRSLFQIIWPLRP